MSSYRTAYYCTRCWKELSWLQVLNSAGACPHCANGSINDAVLDVVKRSIPTRPREPIKHGLEPFFAEVREAYRDIRRSWLLWRVSCMTATDPRLPRIHRKLLDLS